mgnify:FL=1
MGALGVGFAVRRREATQGLRADPASRIMTEQCLTGTSMPPLARRDLSKATLRVAKSGKRLRTVDRKVDHRGTTMAYLGEQCQVNSDTERKVGMERKGWPREGGRGGGGGCRGGRALWTQETLLSLASLATPSLFGVSGYRYGRGRSPRVLWHRSARKESVAKS